MAQEAQPNNSFLWEDRDWLSQLMQATHNELPMPKPKKKSAWPNCYSVLRHG
ncbi:hypothetical protein THIX_60350 [Thiomonas sp. X19]|nr:hypothetical protein THIX_60350 [Thiomonas sp. X19]